MKVSPLLLVNVFVVGDKAHSPHLSKSNHVVVRHQIICRTQNVRAAAARLLDAAPLPGVVQENASSTVATYNTHIAARVDMPG